MSGLETVAFVLTVYPIAVKVTHLLIKAFDGYQKNEDYQDKLLALKLEGNKFDTWVQNRKFTTQRALETRLRKKNRSNDDCDRIMNEFALACELILRILTTITELQDLQGLLDKNARPKRRNSRLRLKPSRSGFTSNDNTSSLTVASIRTVTSVVTGTSLGSHSARSNTTSRSCGRDSRQYVLDKFMNEALARLPDGPSKDKFAASLRSPPSQTLEVSKGRKFVDAVKAVILDRDLRFDQLIHKVKEWNSYLDPLLKELIEDKDLYPSPDDPYNVPFEAPFPRNKSFIGREDIMQAIESHFDTELSARTIILHGPGGYGKSQICLEYAYRKHQFYTAVIWVDAKTASTIATSAATFVDQQIVKRLLTNERGLETVAQILGIKVDEANTFNEDTLRKEICQNAIRILGDWLAREKNTRWLIIADNFDTPDATSEALGRLMPNNDVGHFIVTTQTFKPEVELGDKLKGDPKFCKVGGFEPGLGETFLGQMSKLDGSHRNTRERDAAKSIADMLNNHPLHITLAGAYIAKSRSGAYPSVASIHRARLESSTVFQDYLRDFKEAMRPNPHDPGAMERYVIQLSYDKLTPAAQSLLGILVVLSPVEGIPQFLLDRCRDIKHPWINEPHQSIEGVLMELCSFAMINVTEGTGSKSRAYNMHSTIHQLLREKVQTLPSNEEAYTRYAYSLISNSLTIETQARTSNEWTYEQYILPHLEFAYEHGPSQSSSAFTLADVKELYAFAKVFDHHSKYEKAEVLYRLILERAGIENAQASIPETLEQIDLDLERYPRVPMILDVMDSLGVVLRNLCYHEEASEWGKHASEEAQKRKGELPESFTSQTIKNFAISLKENGDVKGALVKYEDLQRLYELTNTPATPTTPTATTANKPMTNDIAIIGIRKAIADIYTEKGNYDKSLNILDDIERGWTVDVTHPTILEVRRATAAALLEKGDYVEAQKKYNTLIDDKVTILGHNHFSVFETILESGFAYTNHGEFDKAEACFTTAGDGFIKLFGLDSGNPSLLKAWSGLARAREKQGKYREALELYQKIMEGMERRPSGVHKKYAAMNSVASCLHRMGRLNDALVYYREVEKYYKKTYSEDEGHTMVIEYCIALVLEEFGEYEEALKMFKEVLKVEEETAGKGHPSTLMTVRCIASVLERQGKFGEAEEKFKFVISTYQASYPEAHGESVNTKQEYARLLESQGKYEEALMMLEFVITQRKRVYPEHPLAYLALSSKARIIGFYRKEYDNAIMLLKQCITAWTLSLDEDHPWIFEANHNIGSFLILKGKYENALATLTQVLADREKKLGKEHPDTSQTKCRIGDIRYHLEQYQVAEQLYSEVVDEYEKSLGNEHRVTKKAVEALARTRAKAAKNQRRLTFMMKPRIRVMAPER